jgi:hypothetical protein
LPPSPPTSPPPARKEKEVTFPDRRKQGFLSYVWKKTHRTLNHLVKCMTGNSSPNSSVRHQGLQPAPKTPVKLGFRPTRLHGSNTSKDSGQAHSATAPRSNQLIEAPKESHVFKIPRRGPLFGGPLFGMHPKPLVETKVKVLKDTSASDHGMIRLRSPLKTRRQYAKLPTRHLVAFKKQVDIAFRSVNTPKLLGSLER